MKKYFYTAILAVLSTSAQADTWSGQTQDGIRTATVSNKASEISVFCDVGVNAPITSVNFVVEGVTPLPESTVRLEFDKDEPIYLLTDVEGGLGSLNQEDAQNFENVLALLKQKSRVKVRIFDGSEASFRLTGSSKAIGACESDFSRYQLASN